MKRQRRDHVLATILYTDMVGSSRLAAELGDRRWKALLARHHILVRKELKRYGGHEIDNAGDGFLASFDDQERAIRSACAIAEAVRTLGIEIRAGLHVGQAEVLGRKLGGVVVNTGARVMSEAGPGQVVVTGVLKELVPGSGFTFEGLGARELKGIDGRWPLYAVTGIDGNPRPPPPDPSEAERLRDSIKAPPIVQRRWGRVAIAALALVIASTVFAVVASREPPIEIEPTSLLRIDAATGEVIADIPLDGLGSVPVAVPPQSEIWLTNKDTGSISVLDVARSERVRSLPFDLGPQPVGLAFADGSVWARGKGDSVVEISPSPLLPTIHGTIALHERLRPAALVEVTPPSERLTVMAADEKRVWIVASSFLRLFGIDPQTGDVVFDERIGSGSTGLRQVGLAVGGGYVWISTDSGTVYRVDPESRRALPIRARVELTLGATDFLALWQPNDMVFGLDALWVTDAKHGILYRISPTTGTVVGKPIHVGKGSSGHSGVAVAAGKVWVASPGDKSVVIIDPVSATVERRINVPFRPFDVISAYGDVWVTLESEFAYG